MLLILAIFCTWYLAPFAILFRGKAVIVVNPRAWAISRTCILDVTGLSKRLFRSELACLIILIQQWHIGNENGTIVRSLSGAMPSEKSCHESWRISDNNVQMFAEIGHLICSIRFEQEKRNHCVQLCRTMRGINGTRYVNVNIFSIYRTKFNFVKFRDSDVKKRKERKIN